MKTVVSTPVQSVPVHLELVAVWFRTPALKAKVAIQGTLLSAQKVEIHPVLLVTPLIITINSQRKVLL